MPDPQPSPVALSVTGLTKTYGPAVAIDDFTLDVRTGEFISLLGPSGSGKSTVLMALAGFVRPDKGEIRLHGRDIGSLPPERRNFGVVFQGYALFPHMTVRQNIAYPLKLRGIGGSDLDRQVERTMDLVHLSDFAARTPRQLSGGQQQRVALARALVFEPEIVLLDEPLSALDKKLRAELQIELTNLHRRLGTTFVNVTHDQEEAMTMSDRIVILRGGRIQQVGTPEELYNRPATRFVAGFLGRANFIEGAASQLPGGSLEIACGGHTVRHHGPPPSPTGSKDVLLAVRPERVRIAEAGAPVPEAWNGVTGTVTGAAFVGSHHVYLVETPIGLLEGSMNAFEEKGRHAVGSNVQVSWPVDAGVPIVDR
jgi:spermidine/putrescine ABC transporter ATP-binding subunit